MFALGGNPVVLELLEKGSDLDELLAFDPFPAEFRSSNPKLEAQYLINQCSMKINKYEQLVRYITEVGPKDNKLKSYKFPMISSEILAIDNSHTHDILLKQFPTTIQQTITQEIWVEKEIDECDSDFGSESNSSVQENQSKENIHPNNQSQGKRVGSNLSITSDDFPFAEQSPKVKKVKKTVKKKQEREIPPLLDEICGSFNEELNYTLCGYICKVLESLLRRFPRRIIRQFFKKSNRNGDKYSQLLLKHIQSQSVCDFTLNLLLCDEDEMEQPRINFISNIIKSINLVSSENDAHLFLVKNYIAIITELLMKTNLTEPSFSLTLIHSILQNPCLEEIMRKCFHHRTCNKLKETYLSLFVCLLKKIFDSPTLSGKEKGKNVVGLKVSEDGKIKLKKMTQSLEGCFKNFMENLWQSLNVDESGISSGVYLKQLQILNILVRENLFWVRTELGGYSEIFQFLSSICNKFPHNNLLQNQVFQLFKFLTHNIAECESLWKTVFAHQSFLLFCGEALRNKNILYRGQSINLCQAIKSSKNSTISQFKLQFDHKWKNIEKMLYQDSEMINKNLGGFGKKHSSPQMMFEKQAVLDYFGPFLRWETIEEEQKCEDDELADLTSSKGIEEWSEWNEFSNCNADELSENY